MGAEGQMVRVQGPAATMMSVAGTVFVVCVVVST